MVNTLQKQSSIRAARTCYDHLAGELGVSLREWLERRGFLIESPTGGYDLTAAGEVFLKQWQIDAAELRQTRRAFARRCVDWTERRDHIAGSLGAALLSRFLDFHWIERSRQGRTVHLTPEGRKHLEPLLRKQT